MKILIIGGVAGGASAAARARRLDEHAEIVVIERGDVPSFANCGLPYYVGGVIDSRDKLLVAPIEMLRNRLKLDVRVHSEAIAIDRQTKQVTINNLNTHQVTTERYDKLIISTGASPFRPPIPGIDHESVLELRDLKDADAMHSRVAFTAKKAVVVGAGFIGIEVVENLIHRGIETTLVELGDQILPPWDHEMIHGIENQLRDQGVDLRLNDSAVAFDSNSEGDHELNVKLKSGTEIPADFAVVCIGVRPENQLALDCGLGCGPRGGIITNDHMQTSDPDIYAVGDVVQVEDFVTGQSTQVPLGGPANRQGRIAADHIFGRDSSYRGTQGTAVVGCMGMTAAMTGQSEKALKRACLNYEKIYVHPNDHAGYFPGAKPMTIKLIFEPGDGKILGAQAVGTSGVDKRIDVIAMAIQAGFTVYDLEEAELCYAPQYGSAKDPVNMAGFVAAGVLRGDQPILHAERLQQIDADHKPMILDVRTPGEFEQGAVPGAVNIPVESLRDRLSELNKDQKIVAYCKVGMRGYLATRILLQNGFDAVNLSGGYTTWRMNFPET